MSSDSEDAKNASGELNDSSKNSKSDDSASKNDSFDTDEEVPKKKSDASDSKSRKENNVKKRDKADESDDDEEEDQKESSSKPRKKTKKEDSDEDIKEKVDIPKGRGTAIGEIPRIDASVGRFKNDDLKPLHRIMFKDMGKKVMIKANIMKFNGFEFTKDSDEYKKKLQAINKLELKQLKSVCEMLDLEKKGSSEDLAERILEFLVEPKDVKASEGGGRPKRSIATKANNRGYSSLEEESEEEKKPRRKRGRGKKSYKEDSDSFSDQDYNASEEEKPKGKKKPGRKKKADSPPPDDLSDENSISEDEADSDAPKTKRRGRAPAAKPKKPVAETKSKGRPKKNAAPAKKTSPKKAQSDDEASSEDEPLSKKIKTTEPPTDEEIQAYVKQILEGANLEETTMKTVCKKVYANYPDFDLSHKKEFIKSTVKSLILT